LATDLGLDRCYIYTLDLGKGQLRPHQPAWVNLQPGCGPRHFVFHPLKKYLYIANELNSTVTTCAWDEERGILSPLLSLSTLPVGYEGQNDVADIHTHPNGRFLYVSNRGHDSLAIFAIEQQGAALIPCGHVYSGGRIPRHFAIDPEGKFLVVANQLSNSVVTFAIHADNGQLAPNGCEISLPRPVCIQFFQV
jgi:6-phosphogluconolactonase